MAKIETQDDEIAMTDLKGLDAELARIDLATMPHATTLTAQELYVLEKAGYELCNTVIGNIVYSMGLRGILKSFQRALTKGEMTEFTHMNKNARAVARNRMLEDAQRLGADSVVDVVFQTHEYADFIEITCMGTAVKKVRDAQTVDVVVS